MSSTTGADRPLEGRSAVVTGASRGIGWECARALHGAGARVILVARGADTIRQAAIEIGERATGVACDVTDERSLAATVMRIRDTVSGAPDILVNNAGRFTLAPIEETDPSELEATLRVNLVAPFALAQAFLSDMRARRSGHVVTIGSIADRHAFAGNLAYAASKFGARAAHQVIREELRGSGVRASLVSPGPVDTALWDEVDPDTRPGFTKRADMLTAAAVADAVLFVVSRPNDTNVDELRLSRA